MSLRGLINVRIVLSVILILLLGGATAVWQARKSVEKEVQSSINLAIQMLEFGIAQVPVSSRYGSAWLPQISALQQARHLHISITDEEGKPIDLVSQRVETSLDKTPPKWFVAVVMMDYLTAEYDITIADGTKKSILITANPMDEIAEAWGESKAFFWSMAVMLWLMFLAVNMVFHSMFRAVKSILAGLHLVESGQYNIALPTFKISEFDAIAAEINKMSLALKTAQESNQALARHTMHIQEAERRTMSRELHDEMGQSLTAIKAMAVTTKQENVDVSLIADSIIDICNHLSKVVRSMMRTLHPLSLSELGLGATLTDLMGEWRRRHPSLAVVFHYDPKLEGLDHEVAIHVYRIIQECMTNVVRHAHASEVSVSVDLIANQQLAPRVELNVNDNGLGGESDAQGFGVLAMRERVENLGGKFTFKSSEGNGVNVHAWMPYIGKI